MNGTVSVPEAARAQWAALARGLAENERVPCEKSPVPDAWYESGGPLLAAAREECARCPVQALCLAYAVAADESHGMWGGLTHQERARLREAA